MRPIIVIIADVLTHQPLQMMFIQDDDVIQQVSPTAAHPAFGDAIPPRASEAGPLGLDTEALHRADDFFVEVGGAIKDQEMQDEIVGRSYVPPISNCYSLLDSR
jgi:hypothetical protein